MSAPCAGLLLAVLLAWAPPLDAQAQFLGCDRIAQIPREECEALVFFYEVTAGDFWFNNSGWLRGNQPCQWYGITCTSGGWPLHVIRIRLESNNIDGPLPGEIERLSFLQEITIENSDAVGYHLKMFGSLPRALGNLPALEVIRLGHNQFIGQIPFELGRLKKLRVLEINDNQLIGPLPPDLMAVTTLEILDVSNNRLSRALPDFGALTQLEALLLQHNQFTGPFPASLASLQALTLLDLRGNQLTGALPPALDGLDQLIRFNLSDNQFTGPVLPRLAAQLATVTQCDLRGNTLCAPDQAAYRDLTDGPLCGLPLDAGCSLCPAAETVSVGACAALEALYDATDGDAWVRADGWRANAAPCSWHGVRCAEGSVVALELPNNALQGRVPEALGELTALTQLDLSGNALSGPVPEALGTLTALSTFDLSDNLLGGAIPLAVALTAQQAQACDLTGNAATLCLPDDDAYAALGTEGVCGLTRRPQCSPLTQVNLTTFTATTEDRGVRLTWQTDAPADALLFTIEARQEGAFYTVGQVAGTADARAYSFLAPALDPGTFTFRIQQTEPDGTVRYSPEVAVMVLTEGFVLQTPFPNPALRTAQVRFALPSAQHTAVVLTDLLGRQLRVLYAGTPAAREIQTLRVDTDGLPAGLYLIRLTAAGGFQATQKLVVAR